MSAERKRNTIYLIELGTLLIIWALVFFSQVFWQYSTGRGDWQQVFGLWKKLFPFFVLSLVNHFFLVPFFLFKGRKLWYFLSAVVTLVAFSAILRIINPLELAGQRPPQERFAPRPPSRHFPPPPGRQPALQPRASQPLSALPPKFNSALIAILIIGFDTGLRTVFRLSRAEQEKNKLAKEQVESKLAFLRNQINPHFLMNTLNNIHGLIDMDTELAKETVIRLSSLMRYLLYDTERERIPLKEELNFIESYVDLMRMRLVKKVDIKLDLNILDDQRQIPPLLFTSLIENAFKYGVSHKRDTFIHIRFTTTSKELEFDLKNTIAHRNNDKTFYSGIGLENTRHRLDILFGNRYSLDILDEKDIFSVNLKIPI